MKRAAAARLGKGSAKYAIHIQGQELPARDPKSSYGLAAMYRMDATPGRHTRDGDHVPVGLPMPQFDANAWSVRGIPQKLGTNYKHVMDSTGCCMFLSDCYANAGILVDFLNALTGWNYTMDDVLKAGERIANIRHAFNLREGLNPLQYEIPDRIIGKPALKEGPLAGITLDEAAIDREYLAAMDRDATTAKPSRQKLAELDMVEVVQALYP